MSKFIEKLSTSVDLEQVRKDLATILKFQDWPVSELKPGTKTVSNQIALRHRPGAKNTWLDGIGSLKDEFGNNDAYESDFSVWNDQLPEYTRSILEDLSKKENITLGRVRFMRLPSKMGLTIHTDYEVRYHLVIYTNRFALFGHAYEGAEELAKCYHVPADGYFYKVDTTLGHFVYNAGKEDRIHLVICPVAEGNTLKNN
jgi:hypothetical protein